MTTIISEVYDAFREAGVSDDRPRRLRVPVVGLEHAATRSDITDLRAETKADIALLRSDLRAGLAELKAELYRALWIQGGAIVTILAGIGTLLTVWPL